MFTNLNINLSFTKFFLDYFTVQLLKFKVNVFELFTFKEKLKAISNLKFSETFQNLKTYLKFTEWLRNYIFFFAQKSKSLQLRKNALIRFSFSNKEQFRKNFSRSQIINNVIQAEQNVYDQIQKVFARNSFFFHFDHARSLYLDINVFKKWKFDVMIYHDKNDMKYSSDEYSKKVNIQLILFFSRLLTDFEKKYWFIELKMIELI